MNKIVTFHLEDHFTPVMEIINRMHLPEFEDMPTFPEEPVYIERGYGPGGPFVRIMPSVGILTWLTEVRAKCEQALAPKA